MKRAQIEIGETIVVIFILMILMVFGLIVYYQFQSSSAQQTKQRYGGLKTIELAQVISNMPELQCSSLKVSEVSCIDKIKALSLSQYLMSASLTGEQKQRRDKALLYYREILGRATIEIEIIYPPLPILAPPRSEIISIYDNKQNLRNAEPTFIPINLYDPVQKTYAFALLKATRYYA